MEQFTCTYYAHSSVTSGDRVSCRLVRCESSSVGFADMFLIFLPTNLGSKNFSADAHTESLAAFSHKFFVRNKEKSFPLQGEGKYH